ncbi:hypothetical protein DL771_001025 [Monosporascus sp. 5C6A]|nr:hypothetical protein DL771_001025 [Monosporascus sp. 5C6A]
MDLNKSPGNELTEYHRDPPPPPPSDTRNKQEVERVSQHLGEWITRNEDVTSPDPPSLIVHDLISITQLAGRRLRPDEMDLFLDRASRAVVAKSYDRPAAIAATLFLINRGWKGYTFPFYQPTIGRHTQLNSIIGLSSKTNPFIASETERLDKD